MAKEIKRSFGLALGVAAAAAIGYGAYKIVQEINTIVDDNKDFGDKTKEWFAQKREYFAELISDKQKKIDEISEKLKTDVINEIDEIKRRKLVEDATKKIAKLKSEIAAISKQRKDEFMYFLRKTGATGVANAAYKAGIDLKNRAKETFENIKKPKTDLDFDLDLDIIEEDE